MWLWCCSSPSRLFWMWKGAAGFVTAFEATLDALEPYALQKVFAGWLFGICRCFLAVAMQSSAALAHFLHGAVVHARRDPSQPVCTCSRKLSTTYIYIYIYIYIYTYEYIYFILYIYIFEYYIIYIFEFIHIYIYLYT